MKINYQDFQEKKKRHEPIVMLTCYDYPTAAILDKCEMDIILVGDSVGTNILGYSDIRMVTEQDMVHHISAVARGAHNTFILGDLPYCASESAATAIDASEKFITCGAHGIKLEGGAEKTEIIKALVNRKFSVCGHIGYTPQTHAQASVVGKDIASAKKLFEDALAIQNAGAFMIVLELIPAELAKEITRLLTIPTIGIGAGVYCDGQVQVINDIAGLSEKVFKHSHAFGQVASNYEIAAKTYAKVVRSKEFPLSHQSAHLTSSLTTEISSWTLASN